MMADRDVLLGVAGLCAAGAAARQACSPAKACPAAQAVAYLGAGTLDSCGHDGGGGISMERRVWDLSEFGHAHPQGRGQHPQWWGMNLGCCSEGRSAITTAFTA